jgi:hypothetical protein
VRAQAARLGHQLHALAAGLGPLEQRLQHHVGVGLALYEDLLLLHVALDVRHACRQGKEKRALTARRRTQGDRRAGRAHLRSC